MKKTIIAVLIGAFAGAMLCACGASEGKENAGAVVGEEQSAASGTEAQADTASETNAEAEAKPDEGADAGEDAGGSGKNNLAIAAPGYTGMTNIRREDNPDGTYFYEDTTEDGLTIMTNMCYPNSQRDGQAMDAYAENLVCAQVDNDAVIKETVEDKELASKLSYPVYKISYESGANEDTKQAVGVVVLTDRYTFYFGYRCPIDYFDENAEFYNEELQSIELIEL